MTTTASISSKNEALIRSTYDALSRGDMPAMHTLFAPDSVAHIAGRNPLSGDKLGVDALIEYFGELMARTDGNFNVDLRHAFADETAGAGIHQETARRNGRVLDMQNVVVFRLAGELPAGLSERDCEVLVLVAKGLTNKQVAERLTLSPRTVQTHLANVFTKTGVANRAAAALFAAQHRLVN